MEQKFSRTLKESGYSFSFTADFEVEGYLRYRGKSFVKRFDANSYLHITKAMDYFDLLQGKLFANAAKAQLRFLLIAFSSDWLYPAYQSQQLVQQFIGHHYDVTYCQIKLDYGHNVCRLCLPLPLFPRIRVRAAQGAGYAVVQTRAKPSEALA